MRIESIDLEKRRPDHEWAGLQTVFWHIVPEDGDDRTLPHLWKHYETREQAQSALDGVPYPSIAVADEPHNERGVVQRALDVVRQREEETTA